MDRKRAAEEDASSCVAAKCSKSDVLSVCRTVHVSNDLASLLLPTAARRGAVILSFPQLIDYLKEYTTERNLGDKNSSPPRIHCREDPLGTVLGERDFSLYDLPSLLTKHCKSVYVQYVPPQTTWNPEPERPSVLAAMNTVQPTWKPLNVMFCFPFEEEAYSAFKKERGGTLSMSLQEAQTQKEELEEKAEVHLTSCLASRDRTETEVCSSRFMIKQEHEEEWHEEEEDDDESERDGIILNDFDGKKFESPMWHSIYGELTGYETDIIEINDDNYIYLDDVVTEYDFTEYEPASPTSSEPYSESDSEPCFQHYRGTLPHSRFQDDDDDDDDDDDLDKWSCTKCTFLNGTFSYRCVMCLEKRQQKSSQQTYVPKALQKQLQDSQDSGIGTSQCDDMKPIKNCVICLTKPVSTSLIHKGTAHLVCCYKCSRKLVRRRKPCPICRRPIQQIVFTFTS